MNQAGIIFDIQRFSLHDGPGIRTTVFLKGCPLHCIWCHNPESWDPKPQPMCLEDKYGNRVSKISGRRMTVEEVLKEVYADRVYYENSGGGLTVSGGEPMLQYEFLQELLQKSKRQGLHTCIETSGYATQEKFVSILENVDLFLFDIKHMNDSQHQKYTGVSNKIIQDNLKSLYEQGANIVLRCPIIPEINDTDEHIAGIAELTNKYPNVKGMEIIPYHDMGKGKWIQIDKEYSLEELKSYEEAEKEELFARFQKVGCKNIFM